MKTLRLLVAASFAVLLAACATTPKEPPGPNVTGAWTLTIESPMGTRDSDAQFTQTGQELTGRLVSQRGAVPLRGRVTGNGVVFGMTVDIQGTALQIDYTGTVAGDAMTGTVKFGDFGEGKWSGRKKAQ